MNKLKKFLACLLALVMIISLVPMSALAADGYCDVHTDNDSNFVCDVCGKVTVRVCDHDSETLTVVQEYKAPTCGEEGKQMVVNCGPDGNYVVYPDGTFSAGASTVIPATGHSDEDGDGKCDNCKAERMTVKIIIYRNGDTKNVYKSVSVKGYFKGDTLYAADLDIADYYAGNNTGKYKFEGWYNDGGWNNYKKGNPYSTLNEIKINSWTNLCCMVTDYETVVVKAVVDDDKDNAETLTTTTALHGTKLADTLDTIVVEDRISYLTDKWFNWDWYGHKVGDDATVNGWTNVYVTYTTCDHAGDADKKNHDCDACGKTLGECADNDNDHACDICDKTLSECADNDNDHACDICDKTLSECVNDNAGEDHNCDICEKVIDDCVDEGNDYLCDICGACVIDICGYGCDDHEIKQYYQAPTCEKDGHYMVVHCGRVSTSTGSGDYVVHPDGTFAMLVSDADAVIPALKHKYENGVCGVCGKPCPGHEYETIKNEAPTCAEYGYVLQECKICGNFKTWSPEPTGDHFDQTTDNDHKCDVCKKVINDCVDEDKDCLCDVCGVCVIDVCGKGCDNHEIKQDYKAPTCEEEGHYMVVRCTRVSTNYVVRPDGTFAMLVSDADAVIPALKHKYENGVCKVCGKPCPGHEYETIKNEAPTCAEYGYVLQECKICGNFKTWSPEPTGVHVMENGECVNCGYKSEQEFVCEHENAEIENTVPADCYYTGVNLWKCPDCRATWTEEIPATGEHKYENGQCTVCGLTCTEHDFEIFEEVAPTCVEYGSVTEKCTICGFEKTEPIDPTGTHVMENGECVNCGYKSEQEFVCEHENAAIENSVPADCYYEGVELWKCPDCRETWTVTIPATGEHEFEDGQCTVCGLICDHEGETVTKNESETYSGDIHCGICDTLLEEGEIIAVPSTPVKPAKPTWMNWLDKVINNWKDKGECPEESEPEVSEPEVEEPEESVPAAPITPAKPNWSNIIRGCWNSVFRVR